MPTVQRAKCYGCQTNDSVEQQHQCLLYSLDEKLHLWFDDVVARVNENQVAEQYMR